MSFPLPPVLVVDDEKNMRLSLQTMLGDESLTKDMTRYNIGANRIRAATKAVILLIHHTARNGLQERGSTAPRNHVKSSIRGRRTRWGGRSRSLRSRVRRSFLRARGAHAGSRSE